MADCMSLRKLSFKFLILFILISSCAETIKYNRPVGMSAERAQQIGDMCWSNANVQSPIYMCRALTCAPDEFGLVVSSISRRDRLYHSCLLNQGFTVNR